MTERARAAVAAFVLGVLIFVAAEPTPAPPTSAPTLPAAIRSEAPRDVSAAAPSPTPAEARNPSPPGSVPASAEPEEGVASYVRNAGDRYLALPDGPGHAVTICGPVGCWAGVSTDKGPDQRVHPDRIADLSPAAFRDVCGELWRGLCRVTVRRTP